MLLAHRFLVAVWLAMTFVLSVNAQTTEFPLSERPGDSDTDLHPYVEEPHSRTEHSRVWARIHHDAEGEFARQERYTELAAGLHWNAAEKEAEPLWLPTRVEWELQPDGSALILEAPHTAWLAPDLLSTPFLRSDPVDSDRPPLAFAFQGVAYLQTETDEVAWVARPQHAQLEVNGAVAYYRDALDNLSASWVVESRMDGLSAGIVLHELPLPPTSYGFEPDEPVDLIVISVLVNPDPAMEISRSGVRMVYGYDSLGRRNSQTQEMTSGAGDVQTTTEYDSTGRVWRTTDAAGNVTEYVYDPTTGELSEIRVPDPDSTGTLSTYFDYTSRGELWRTWGDVHYPVEYAYDDWGRMIQMKTFRGGTGWNGVNWPASPGIADTTTWTYDEGTGLLTAKTDAASRTVTYTYWGNGKLKSRTWARGGTTNYTYVGAYYGGSGANSGELHTVDYPDGGISDVSYTYDRAGLVYTINDAAGTHTFSYTNLLPTSETISGSFYAQS